MVPIPDSLSAMESIMRKRIPDSSFKNENEKSKIIEGLKSLQ